MMISVVVKRMICSTTKETRPFYWILDYSLLLFQSKPEKSFKIVQVNVS